MARQLVFTSAPQGLTPGRTGYCTVARPRDMRDRLAAALEGLSLYPADWQPAPIVCAFRLIDIGDTRFPVLSRIVNAGLDYTHRGHFLAHHLALDPEEITSAPPPAEVFRRWNGWRNRWDGPARWLDEKDWVDLTAMRMVTPPALPAETWARVAHDAGRAALLVEGLNPVTRVLRCAAEQENELLGLLCEASALLPPAECWRTEFTTCLQPTDAVFRWAIIRAGSPTEATAPRSGVIDLTQPATLPPAPENALARRARGTAATPPAPAAPIPRMAQASRAAVVPAAEILPRKSVPENPAIAMARAAKLSAKTSSYSPNWIFGAVAGLLVGVVIIAIVFWPSAPAPTPKPISATPPPVTIFTPTNPLTVPDKPASLAPAIPEPVAIAPPAPTPVVNDRTNIQQLNEIEQLARTPGQAFVALDQWKALAAAAPDYAKANANTLTSQVLPNARKEWLGKLDQLTAGLATGKSSRADLAAQLAALRDFPTTWPVAKPAELTQAADAIAAKLTLLNELPDAPVWVLDKLLLGSPGSDYRDATVTLAIPELNALLSASAGKFHVSAAPATSLQLPAANEWFNFNILPVDFSAGSYLILHDASRGEAGGRLLQLILDKPGQVKLTWRIFQPDSQFFQRYPANAPLRPISREFWLHFAGEAPLPSFYLLVQRPGDVVAENWKPLILPQTWLSVQGAPARVNLPSWLANHLLLHAPAGTSFHLEPLNPGSTGTTITVTQSPADTAATVDYQAAKLIDELNNQYRALQTDAERAQQQLDAFNAITDAKSKPSKAMVDQVTQTVKKLQGTLAKLKTAADQAGQPQWANSVSPWLLYCNPATNEPRVFLQFSPHETGPTP